VEAGSAAQTCLSCLQPVDPEDASDLQALIQDCPSVLATAGSAAGPTATAGGLNGEQCGSQCAPITQVISQCGANQACACPTFISAGPGCSQCYATINATVANEIGTIVNECQGVVGPTPGPGGAGDQCVSPCAPISSVLEVCGTNEACACPSLLSAGPACSQCYLTANITLAVDIGSIVSLCQAIAPSTTSHLGPTTQPSGNGGATSTGGSSKSLTLVPVTTASKSGARGGVVEMMGTTCIQIVMFLIFVGGVFGVLL
jgi:hypothetical protein